MAPTGSSGRLVLSVARRPSDVSHQAIDIDLEILACSQRVIAHTAAHFRRTGWLTPRACRSGKWINPTQEHAK